MYIDKKKHENGATAVSSEQPTTVSAAAPTSEEISAYLEKNNINIHSTNFTVTPVLEFAQLANLNVHPDLRKATDKFKIPSLIQAASWPPALAGKDVIGIAETGR